MRRLAVVVLLMGLTACGSPTAPSPYNQTVTGSVDVFGTNRHSLAIPQTGNMTLTPGKVFVAISNTAATPISGTFANLPDGSTFTVGPNTFQVSYSGGDGNDLTLTVVP